MIELDEEKIWVLYKEWEKLLVNGPSGQIEASVLGWALKTLGFPTTCFVDRMKTERSLYSAKNQTEQVKLQNVEIYYQCCACGFTFSKIGDFNRFNIIKCPRCEGNEIQIYKVKADNYTLWERS